MSLIIQAVDLNAFELLSSKVKEFQEITNLVGSVDSIVEPQVDYSGVEGGFLNQIPVEVKIIKVGFREVSNLKEKNLIDKFISNIRMLERELSIGGESQQ